MEVLKIIATAFFSAAVLFGIAKVMGHKQMSQLDFFDYISGITIGSIAAEMATELEKPWNPLIAMVVYGGITVLLSRLTEIAPKTRKFVNGSPTILMDNGKLYPENLKKAKIDLSDFMVMCRQEGYFDLNEIQTAVFEYNGRLTVLPKSPNRPLTPADMGMVPAPAAIGVEVILDGKILEENLKRMGRDRIWLEKELKGRGFSAPKDIFLGVCDPQGQLTVFEK